MRRLLIATAALAAVFALPSSAATTSGYDPFFANPQTIADFGAATRPLGIAAGDYDRDGKADLVVGRATGNVAFVKGNGDGTFSSPSQYAWKQTAINAWAFAPADVNGDGNLDVVWGATAATSGCSVSPVPAGGCPATVNVADGDVRAFLGNGNGTFQETTYFVSGVRHNAGVLLARPGAAPVDASSIAAADIDADGDTDLVAGAVDGSNAVVKVLRNTAGVFSVEGVISQSAGCSTNETTTCGPTYFPPTSAAMPSSPWGLALADADADGDTDLLVGDRALYVYLYRNDGTGVFTLQGSNSAVSGRPNVYIGHDSVRAAVGFTPSLAAGDVNGDGRADLAVGVHSGGQTPTTGCRDANSLVIPCAHDGEVVLDLARASGFTGGGALADLGTMARGVSLVDVNGDGARDIVAGVYEGSVKLLRQLTPVDTDGDGITDYVDNAPADANAPRLDMNTDGSITYRDQLDSDADTVLGNPEDQSTWLRLGDIADPDDDNDLVLDGGDNCRFVANADQADTDTDGVGDVCDPLDGRDADADGVPTGPLSGPDLAPAQAAAATWSRGTTHFVVRIDALGRFFQNEFTQLMTDAATLSPEAWAAKCWEDYQPGDVSATYEPCGDDVTKTLTLGGGKQVPISLVTIPKQLWTDPPVIAWINDRNDDPRFELDQHATYHVNNTPLSDWATAADRNFYSCEICGLSEAENFELLKVGYDTLLGNYDNPWVAQSGATAASPKIDWARSAHRLISFAPPYNTSDTIARKAVSELGFKAFSASVYEEGDAGSYGPIFTPEGSHHERFDQFGMFHASADVQLAPPDTTGDTYDPARYDAYLHSVTDDGGLTTWLIEEVDWSGRPCNNADRLGTCNGGDNRENNTVYLPRWNAWLQVLDYVDAYPGGVAMTMDEVALAKAYDNAPTVTNPGQADADHDAVGDVIDGATLTVPVTATLSRNVAGALSAALKNGAGDPIPGQVVTFMLDADGDGAVEESTATTNASGVASISVTATRPVGPAGYDVRWDGLRVQASASGVVDVADATTLRLAPGNPGTGQVTDSVAVSATLADSDGSPLPGRTVAFAIATATASALTDATGVATATLTLPGPAAAATLSATFAGGGAYGPASASHAFTVEREDTALALADVVAKGNMNGVALATLTEADGAPLAGRTITWFIQDKVRGQITMVKLGTSATNAGGVATYALAAKYLSKAKRPIQAAFDGDGSFTPSTATAYAYWP